MKLSKSQKEAIAHIQGPALILAVPGAGKTTVLIHRTGNLIKNHQVDPRSILSITFSRASARDMKNRFDQIYPEIEGVHFSTIHSFAFSIVRAYAQKNRKRYILIDSDKSPINKYALLRQLYYKYNSKNPTEDKLDNLINNIGYVKNMSLNKEEIKEEFKSDRNFHKIFYEYEDIKKENNLIDFDDMLTFALDILKKDGDLYKKYTSKYRYIQVDEAQDTSKVQIDIIKLLAYPHNNLFVVADDDQSIYGFRGAYPEGLFHFEDIYEESKIFYMEDNYRSKKDIVQLSNNFINQNTIRFKKDIRAQRTGGQSLQVLPARNLADQYNKLVKDLQTLDDYTSTAILFRNNISAIGLIDALEKNSLPFSNRDRKLRFFNHFIIRDLKDFFYLAHNPSNLTSFERIYYKMKGFTSKKQLNHIKAIGYNEPVFQRLLNIPGLNSFYQNNFYELERDFNRLANMNFKQGVSLIEYDLEYNEYLKDSARRYGQSYESLKNILSLVKIIGEDSDTIDDFLARLKIIKEAALDKSKEGITLSTMHSSKGLEFDNVYIVDLIRDEFPSSKIVEDFSRENIKDYEEERRLFYVAMTRAKNNLTLLVPSNKSPIYQTSEFVEELNL